MGTRAFHKTLSSAQVVNANATAYSEPFDATNAMGVSFHMVSTGATVGTATVQHSNDGSSWEDTTTTFTFTNTLNSVKQIGPTYIGFYRLKYAPTTGNATITTKALGKVGA